MEGVVIILLSHYQFLIVFFIFFIVNTRRGIFSDLFLEPQEKLVIILVMGKALLILTE